MGAEQQKEIADFIRRVTADDLVTPSQTRGTYSNREMSNFSTWHRHLPSWYAWSDIDYVGAAVDDGDVTLYVLLEVKELPADQFDPFAPSEPASGYQRALYQEVAEQMGVPAFILYWHADKVDEFIVDPIHAEEYDEHFRLSGKDQFCDFLDDYRKRVVSEGGGR